MSNNNEFDFVGQNNELFLVEYDEETEKESRTLLTAEFYPEEVFRDVDTEETSMRLRTLFRNFEVKRDVTYDKLLPNGLMELVRYGYPFSDTEVRKYVSEWLMLVQDELPLTETTKQLGWKEKGNKRFFQLATSISKDKDISVTYNGDLVIEKAGTWEEYKEFLVTLVLPHIQMQAMVAFSVASALATYLGEDLTLTIHVCGETSSGKTTLLAVSASVWSSAKRKANGVHQTWNSTNNALINGLCGIDGLTLCFDELGASDADAKSFLALIYKLSMGIDKKRMNSDNSNARFAVNVVSSGEIPIKLVQEANGADVRLLEINYPWTESKEHAEKINAALRNCYGHLGEKFVKVLLDNPKEKFESSYRKLYHRIVSEYSGIVDGMTKKNKRIFLRAVKKIAVVSLSAYVMKKTMRLDFDYMGIAKFLIERSSLLELPGGEHIRFLEAYINSLCEDRVRVKAAEKQGNLLRTFDFEKDGYIIMRSEYFYSTMGKRGFSRSDCNAHLHRLNKEGYLHTEKGKLYNRRQFDGAKCACIELVIDKLDQEQIYHPYC